MKASSKFLAASAITAAFTWSTLTQAFGQNSSNDRDVAVAKTANYKVPAPAADGDTLKFVGGGNGFDPVEVKTGTTTDAQDRSIKDRKLAFSVGYGKGNKLTIEQIVEALSRKLQEQGIKASEMVFYTRSYAGKGGGVSLYIPPGERFGAGVIRNEKAEVVYTFTPLEVLKNSEDIAKEYKQAMSATAKSTPPPPGL